MGFYYRLPFVEKCLEKCLQCEDCKDSLDFFVPPPDVADIAIKYQQWQTVNKYAEKVQINATVGDIFDNLKSRPTVFLTHHYVKRIQASHMENLISSCNGKTILLQVDFSENASLLIRNEIQIIVQLLCLQLMHG